MTDLYARIAARQTRIDRLMREKPRSDKLQRLIGQQMADRNALIKLENEQARAA